jgi:hypothetical protein
MLDKWKTRNQNMLEMTGKGVILSLRTTAPAQILRISGEFHLLFARFAKP